MYILIMLEESTFFDITGTLDIHPEYKLPYSKHRYFQNFTEIPFENFVSIETIKKRINNKLVELEEPLEIRHKYLENEYGWSIEYGTKPLEYTVPHELINIVLNKKSVALDAAHIGYTKFGKFFENDDNFENNTLPDPIPIFDNGKWCRINIFLYYNENKNTLIISYERVSKGDRSSFYPIYNTIDNLFNDIKLKKSSPFDFYKAMK